MGKTMERGRRPATHSRSIHVARIARVCCGPYRVMPIVKDGAAESEAMLTVANRMHNCKGVNQKVKEIEWTNWQIGKFIGSRG